MSDLAQIPTREDIERLQVSMRSLPQVVLETKHHFADGMYARELFRPKDTTIVGKVHKREHFYIVLSGDVTIVGEGGSTRVKAPCIFVSPPGTKRAVYAHEDSTCLTVHRTDSTDLDAIEQELVEPDDTALFNARNQVKQELLP